MFDCQNYIFRGKEWDGNLRKRFVWKVAGSILTTALLVSSLTMHAAWANPSSEKEKKLPNQGDAHQGGWNKNIRTTLSLTQIGDLHGHLTPRPNLTADGSVGTAGGLARVAATIKKIKKESSPNLLFNVGDTIQGGAEALYTQGQAMSDILDKWHIDGYAPGNWDFVYGTKRFLNLFQDERWGAVAANLYYDGESYADKAGQRVLPPYRILKRGGLRIGVVGFTTERGPTVGNSTTTGFRFTGDGEELPGIIDKLRKTEKVDLVIMLSELGLGKNVLLADRYPGVDVLLSADMHERTPKVVKTKSGTLVSEVGQDGTIVGQLDLQIGSKGITGWRYKFHSMDDSVPSDPETAKMVSKTRSEFISGKGFQSHQNPINQTILQKPIDTIIGKTNTLLYRGNFSDNKMPGVIEGSSHDFLADTFREETGSDIGTIRGFRYGTVVNPGDISLEDIYHFIPVAPFIAKGTVTGRQLQNQIEASLNGALNPDPFKWTGGWVQAYSGLRYDLDPYAPAGSKTKNITVFERKTGSWQPLDLDRKYTVAGYWYTSRPDDIGTGLKISDTAQPVTGADGKPLDAIEVVARYLSKHPADPELGRVRLLSPLPKPIYGNQEIQPLLGVPERR